LPTFVFKATADMCTEPDMLTVGAGTVVAPEVELFTYGTAVYKLLCFMERAAP